MRLRRNKEDTKVAGPQKTRAKPGLMTTLKVGSKPTANRRAAARVRTGAPGGRIAAAGAGPAARGRQRDGAAPARDGIGRPELVKQREALSKRFAELQWDLGGITYEMGKRRQFRREVLVKRADELKKVDAELGQIERVLRMDREGAAGECPHCGALQARGAVFCWQCGKELMPKAKGAKGKPTAKQAAQRRKTTSSKAKAK